MTSLDAAAVLRGDGRVGTPGPDSSPGHRRPLLLLLHGYGSSERDLPGLVDQLPPGLDWASPRAPLRLPQGGHAWVPITVPGRPDPQATARAADAVLAWLSAHVPADVPVVPLGFSQGGLIATQLLRHAPARFAAAVVLSGFALEGRHPGDEELARRRPPVYFGHGDADQVITAEATARTSAWLPTHTTPTDRLHAGLGHGIDAAELAEVAEFLTHTLALAP
ncbi:alpha/beta hydrolase [Cellulomonas soli]|uniref:alpha/beta hydrolase n=1 Tax=Cellulomonas soli TaxID=931535 RepID=UPI003F82927D